MCTRVGLRALGLDTLAEVAQLLSQGGGAWHRQNKGESTPCSYASDILHITSPEWIADLGKMRTRSGHGDACLPRKSLTEDNASI